jgi:hypothetical protein
MTDIALYTYGILDPAIEPMRLRDFMRRGSEIFAASADAPGFLGQADAEYGAGEHQAGADFGRWGSYALPLGLPDFAGFDPTVHIATLSLWRDLDTARDFVYNGLHRDALRHRYEWFVRGPWPGQVLWPVAGDAQPTWSDGVDRIEALAREGDSAEHFTFRSTWGRA